MVSDFDKTLTQHPVPYKNTTTGIILFWNVLVAMVTAFVDLSISASDFITENSEKPAFCNIDKIQYINTILLPI